jgi:PPOX class probable F420-dependent enzyme
MSQTTETGVRIPESHRDIIEAKNFAHLATLMPGGSPQVTPVWVELEGDLLEVNSALNRQKDRNIERDPRVALSVQDSANPYRYIQVRGRVVERTTEGAGRHIDRLAKKYLGVEVYPGHRPGETRVIYTIRPEKVQAMG